MGLPVPPSGPAHLDCNDISDFDVGKTLGTGSFGRVKIAKHIQSNTSVALKMLRKRDVMKFNQVRRKDDAHPRKVSYSSIPWSSTG